MWLMIYQVFYKKNNTFFDYFVAGVVIYPASAAELLLLFSAVQNKKDYSLCVGISLGFAWWSETAEEAGVRGEPRDGLRCITAT